MSASIRAKKGDHVTITWGEGSPPDLVHLVVTNETRDDAADTGCGLPVQLEALIATELDYMDKRTRRRVNCLWCVAGVHVW